MKNQIMKALKEFVNTADALLNNRILAAYCFGSAVYDDFHEGYSDLDFFLIEDSLLSEEDFDQFHLLREQYKHSTNPYLSVLEGEIVPISARFIPCRLVVAAITGLLPRRSCSRATLQRRR